MSIIEGITVIVVVLITVMTIFGNHIDKKNEEDLKIEATAAHERQGYVQEFRTRITARIEDAFDKDRISRR